jgi:hypothetical protein
MPRHPLRAGPFALAWLAGSLALACLGSPLAAQSHNYVEALQNALYFYEAQAAGRLPDHHRVEWRGPSTLRDGSDVGRDLTGGWYDAGDGVVWTSNDAYGATLLAWALVNYRAEFVSTGQYARGLDALRHGTDYLLKCLDPASSTGFRIYVGKGSTTHAPPNNPVWPHDHTGQYPQELLDVPNTNGGTPATVRPSYWVDSATGGADVAGHVAAALASASIAFRQGRDAAYADTLLAQARAVYAWGEANPNSSTTTRRLTNGAVVDIPDYPVRSAAWTKAMLWGAAWLHRAELSAATAGYTAGYIDGYIDKAEALYNSSAHSAHRLKHWRSLAPGDPDIGAYPMLAVDSGRAVFVTETHNYANFWLNDRSNTSGVTTDPTLSPAGFVARIQGPGFNIHQVLDQAAPLFEWADSPRNTNATQKANIVALYTGSYTNTRGLFHPVPQIDYVLGDNPLGMSYLQGYAKPGYTWVDNLHYRSGTFLYGGFGTPAAEQPIDNTFTTYGLLAPGPDHTDFYPIHDSAAGAGNYGYREPVIYTGGLLSVLGRRIRQLGGAAGQPLPVFPPWIPRPATYQTDGFYVSAYRRTDFAPGNGIRVVAHLANRASLPAREVANIGFRLYFTLDGTTNPANVTLSGFWPSLAGNETCVWSGPTAAGGNLYYFEFRYTNCGIGPGEYNNWRRTLEFSITQSAGVWDSENDAAFAGMPSAEGLSGTPVLRPDIPVYDFGTSPATVLGGFAPNAGVIRWRRARVANVTEKASSVTLIAERAGGRAGPVAVAFATADDGAAAGQDYLAANGTLSWADGETGEKTLTIPLIEDGFFEDRPSFLVNLASATGGAVIEGSPSARVFIEDDDFDAPARPVVVPFEVRIASPAAASAQGGAFTVNGTASGPDGIAAVHYRVGTGPWIAANGSNVWSFALSNLPSGPLTIEVRATSASPTAPTTVATLPLTVDATGPLVSNVSAGANVQTAFVGWNTDEPADSRVLYGVSPSALTLDSGLLPGLRTAHGLTLSGLAASTTYYFQVVSSDPFGNVGIGPTGSFTTGVAPVFVGNVAEWDFAGTGGAGSSTASAVATGLSASVVTLGSGLRVTTTSNGLTGNQQTSANLAGALSGADYLTFTLTPAAGWNLRITALKLRPISSNGWRTFTVFSSIDGFASGQQLGAISHNGGSGAPVYTISTPNLPRTAGPVEFRIYIHGQTNSNRSVGLGNGTGSDLVVEGELHDPPPTFTSWISAAAQAVPADRRGPLDDPDGDGLPNSLEYALGGNPIATGDTVRPVLAVTPAADALTLTYRRLRADLDYRVETSTTLAPDSWSSAGVDQGSAALGGEVTASVPVDAGSERRFLRLRVELAP